MPTDSTRPEIPGVQWHDDANIGVITRQFWRVWSLCASDMKASGLRISKASGAWMARWRPTGTPLPDAPEPAATHLWSRLYDVMLAGDLLSADRKAEAVEYLRCGPSWVTFAACAELVADAERRIRRRAREIEAAAAKVPVTCEERDAARALIRDCITRNGLALCGSILPALMSKRILSRADIAEITRRIADVDQRAAGYLSEARRAADGVLWSDEIIIDAVARMTEADLDHATVRNASGWSRADSYQGHWCHASIQSGDPERKWAGITLARRLIGKYARQIEEIGANNNG